MAVETLSGDYVMSKLASVPVKVASFHHFDNPYKALMDRVTVPAAADIASTIKVGQVKPDAVLSSLGFVQFAAMGAAVTFALGFADDSEIGLSGQSAALNAATDVSSAGTMAVGAAVSLADRFKPMWQLAGLSERPSKPLVLVITQAGAASAAGGDVAWEIPFTSY